MAVRWVQLPTGTVRACVSHARTYLRILVIHIILSRIPIVHIHTIVYHRIVYHRVVRVVPYLNTPPRTLIWIDVRF